MGDLNTIFGSDFNSDEYEPTTDYAILEPGKYPVAIEESSVQTTKSGNGHYLKLALRVIDGKYKGAILFDNLNIDNPSNQAVEIAKRTLSAICRALSLPGGRISDSAQLVGGKLTAHVKFKDEKNFIRTYSELQHDTSSPSQNPSIVQRPNADKANTPPQTQSAPRKLPWES